MTTVLFNLWSRWISNNFLISFAAEVGLLPRSGRVRPRSEQGSGRAQGSQLHHRGIQHETHRTGTSNNIQLNKKNMVNLAWIRFSRCTSEAWKCTPSPFATRTTTSFGTTGRWGVRFCTMALLLYAFFKFSMLRIRRWSTRRSTISALTVSSPTFLERCTGKFGNVFLFFNMNSKILVLRFMEAKKTESNLKFLKLSREVRIKSFVSIETVLVLGLV